MVQPPASTQPYSNRDWLIAHMKKTLAFYAPRCVDEQGGFFHFYLDDGTVYDRETRHLVSSTRFVVNFARAAIRFGEPRYLDFARHGLAFLAKAHRQANGGYAWLLRATSQGASVTDGTNHCYGLAFVVLAYSEALRAGIAEARAPLAEAVALMDRHFWLPEHGLFADEASADFSVLSPYRGQNANMHACEAFIAAWQATGVAAHLHRAQTLAESVATRLAAQADGRVWEHYDASWRIDWNYNLDDPKHLFRPWGFQPGHQTEWAKLLLTLARIAPNAVQVNRAKQLFDRAMKEAWDAQHGGLVYGIAPDGSVCDSDKYFWVQAESLATAAQLAEATGDAHYWDWYARLWDYSWRHFVDPEHGAWYRILDRENRKYSNEKSPAGKVDYHTLGACFETLDVLDRLERRA